MYYFEWIVDLKFRTEKRVLLIFIVDYSAQEKEYGNGMKKWEGRKGPPLNLAWRPDGLIRPWGLL